MCVPALGNLNQLLAASGNQFVERARKGPDAIQITTALESSSYITAKVDLDALASGVLRSSTLTNFP